MYDQVNKRHLWKDTDSGKYFLISPIIKLTRQFIKLQKVATKHKHKGTNVL